MPFVNLVQGAPYGKSITVNGLDGATAAAAALQFAVECGQGATS